MRHNELKTLAQTIGRELQDAASDANVLVVAIEAPEAYETPEDWIEYIEGEADELVATLDILALKCAAARDALDAAKRGVVATTD